MSGAIARPPAAMRGDVPPSEDARRPRGAYRIILAMAWAMAMGTPSYAAETAGWVGGDVVIKASAAPVLFDSAATVKVAGVEVPGGSAKLSNNVTILSEIE